MTTFVNLRITFGDVAKEGEFPWLAALFYVNKWGDSINLCGGALISPRHVVTAAHCLAGQSNFKLGSVRLGQADLSGPGGRQINISKITPHPRYISDPVAKFDIAVLELVESVEFTDKIRPICLPEEPKELAGATADLLTEQDSIVAGWGRTESAWSSQSLRYTHLTTLSNPHCSILYQRALAEGRLGPLDMFDILDTQLCALGEEKSDSCSGDSGGPIFAENEEGRTFLIGVVSFGTVSCDSSLPGVYTRVSSFTPWIHNIIDNHRVN